MEFATYRILDLSCMYAGCAFTSAELCRLTWQTNNAANTQTHTHTSAHTKTQISRRPRFHLPQACQDQTFTSVATTSIKSICLGQTNRNQISPSPHMMRHISRLTFQDMYCKTCIPIPRHSFSRHTNHVDMYGSDRCTRIHYTCRCKYSKTHISRHTFQDIHFKTQN